MILALGNISIPFAMNVLKRDVGFGLIYDSNNSDIAKLPIEQLDHYSAADFSNLKSVVEAVKSVDQQIDAFITNYENYILIVARVADELNINSLPLESAKKVTNKILMRKAFSDHIPGLSPKFSKISNISQLLEFSSRSEYPLIIKPANLVKSLYVTKVENEEQLVASYKKISNELPGVYKRLNINVAPEILVEEFIVGSIHSVDGVVDSKGKAHMIEAVVDSVSGFEVGFADNFHYTSTLPSKLSKSQSASIVEAARQGVNALGIKSSAAHVELFMTSTGPKIIEIGARNGGYRAGMHELSNGVDYYGAIIDALLKRPIDLAIRKREAYCVVKLFPNAFGRFKEVVNEKKLLELKSVIRYQKLAGLDQQVGLAGDGFKATARVFMHSKDSKQLEEDKEYIRNYVSVKIT